MIRHKLGLSLYGGLWKAARPLLARNERLKNGFAQRLVPEGWPLEAALQAEGLALEPGPYRLWLQAASGGEAYLAEELLDRLSRVCLKEGRVLRALCTSCTIQGLEALRRVQARLHGQGLDLTLNYFPLDEPGLMRRAVRQAFGGQGGCLALLETEIWPGLLAACREAGCSVLILNGRMNEKSKKGYAAIKGFLRANAPARILATGEEDLKRFKTIFGPDAGPNCEPGPQGDEGGQASAASGEAAQAEQTEQTTQAARAEQMALATPAARPARPRYALMSNIKFDRVRLPEELKPAPARPEPADPSRVTIVIRPETEEPEKAPAKSGPLASLFDPARPCRLAVFGSVRKEEAEELLPVLPGLLVSDPGLCLVLAPRHLHLIDFWLDAMRGQGLNPLLRSALLEPGGQDQAPGQAPVQAPVQRLAQTPAAFGAPVKKAGKAGELAEAAQAATAEEAVETDEPVTAGEAAEAEALPGAPAGASGAKKAAPAAANGLLPESWAALDSSDPAEGGAPFVPGRVLLWDIFGELDALYEVADAVFVGGSLADLGGQNFLEPAAHGLVPCLGPSWRNFYWVGEEFFSSGLARRLNSAKEVAENLLDLLENPEARGEVAARFRKYLEPRRGGADEAARALMEYLDEMG